MVYGTQITIVMGVYKPTNITGGPHIVVNGWFSSASHMVIPCHPHGLIGVLMLTKNEKTPPKETML
jgi:hypothetical protein